MITDIQIQIAEKLVATGLVDAVYHSVELVEDDKGVKLPAYKQGKDQYYVGPDDAKGMFGYIRQNGNATVLEKITLGSCSNGYKMKVSLRIVVFKDNEERDFEALIKKLLNVVFQTNLTLLSYTNNAFRLGKDESPIGDFAFDATTFYLGIDVQATYTLNKDDCESDNCIVHPNPYCK